jgi:hypothetical protein
MRSALPFLLAALLAGCGKHSNVGSEAEARIVQPQWFTNIPHDFGISFTHVAGTNYFMPDQIGSGVCLADFDNDGLLDIYVVQNGGANKSIFNRLFLREPTGKFREASAGSGADIFGYGMGAYAGDVNNDGLADLLVTEYGATRLFQNLGWGKFREVSGDCGIANPRWATAASFFDYDRDGRLDIVVGNYLDYDPTQICRDLHGQLDFCGPQRFGDTATRLWRNITPTNAAEPRFEEATETAGLTQARGAVLGIVCADFDGDTWPDIFCSDDGRPNRLFINRQDGTFSEEAGARGVAYNAMGRTAANMGVAFGDVNGDAMADLFVTHLTEEFHSFWQQGPRGIFTDQIAIAGLQQQEWRGTGFGAIFADFNCDGALDLVFANGLVRRLASPQKPVLHGVDDWWARYAQRPQCFVNDGSGRFRDVSTAQTNLCGTAFVGRSLGIGDINGDGLPDLVLCGIGGPARILLNTHPLPGNSLRLRLLDPTAGDRYAIGTEVMVRTPTRRLWALCQPATSYLCSNDPAIFIGLGTETFANPIEVLWPDGSREAFSAAAAPQGPSSITLRKGSGLK